MKAKLKCTDLRIGNFLKYNNKIVEVFGLRPRYVEFYDKDEFLVGDNPEYFDPIELTEDILLKIGFENCDARYVDIYKIEKWIDEFNFISIDYRYLRTGNTTLNITHTNDENYNQCTLLKNNIKYLHQLQNAYNLLTNQELEIIYDNKNSRTD